MHKSTKKHLRFKNSHHIRDVTTNIKYKIKLLKFLGIFRGSFFMFKKIVKLTVCD